MKVSLNLIVGFLGSGKTTLIKDLVPMTSKKVAIIENEFGEVNIDEDLLSKEGLIFDISNGCLCCSMRGDLIVNLKKILDESQNVEHIFIEATGVAEPGPIIETILGSEYFNNYFELHSVISVFDESSYSEAIKNEDEEALSLMASQLSMATFCYLTKGEGSKEVLDFIYSQNPLTKVVQKSSEINIHEKFLDKNIEHISNVEGSYPFNEILVIDPNDKITFTAQGSGRFAYFFAANDFETNIHEAISLFASKMALLSEGKYCFIDSLYSLKKAGDLPRPQENEEGLLCLVHSFKKLDLSDGKEVKRVGFNSSVRFTSLVNAHSFDISGKFNLEKLQLFINYTLFQYGERLYRSKGIINLDDGRVLLFQGVYSTFTFNIIPDRKEGRNKIVFIGKDLKAESIHAGLLNCLG